MKIPLSILTGLILSCIIAFSQEITGQWHGMADINGTKLRITFNISKDGQNYSATMDSPDQGAKGIPVDSVIFDNPVIKIKISKIFFEYKGELKNNDLIEGTVVQGGMSIPLKLGRKEIEAPQKASVKRAQNPVEPYPYLSEDVKFRNEKENFSLAGTFTLPSGSRKFPAVILISGSGLQNRDEEIMGHKPFLVLSDYLTRKGIAVLRYDDRGCAGSEGDPLNATTADFATDAQSAIEYLKSRKEIDPKKIGIIGHSEGGIIAFMLAAKNKNIPFIVSMAGSAIKGDSILLQQRQAIFKASGMTDEQIAKDSDYMREAFQIAQNTSDKNELKIKLTEILEGSPLSNTVDILVGQFSSPWMRYFLSHDPSADIAKVKCAVLALNGDKDLQVISTPNLNTIKNVLNKNGNNKVTIKEYPALNHLFQSCQTGSPVEYEKIEETINPQVLHDIAEWILKTVK